MRNGPTKKKPMTELAMAAHQPKPTELQSRLELKLGAHRRAVDKLEQERMRLTLPAHSGDEQAAERLRQVRVEVSEHTAAAADIEQALADLQPQVRAQRAGEVLEVQRATRDSWERAMDELFEALEQVDTASHVYVAAVRGASQKQATARQLLVNLLVSPRGDVAHTVINRLLAYDGAGFRDLSDQAIETMRTLLKSDRPDLRSAMAPAILETKRGGDQRIADVMGRYEHEARAAGAALQAAAEPEAA